MAPTISPRGTQVIAWAYAMFSLAAIIVFLRIFVRSTVVRVVGREDLIITIALVFSLLQSIFMHLQISNGGLGQHFDSLTSSQILRFSKEAYFTIIAYNASLCATKFSILFFNVNRWRKIYLTAIVLLGIYAVWVIIYSILPCVPIRSRWDKNVSGWCFPRVETWVLNAALNILTDFLIVMLPIPAIMTLQLPIKQKIGVSLIFALGLFVCIISVLRIPSLLEAGKTKDPTYDNCGIAIWSIVEVNAAIIGACLSTLKPLISRVWPRLLFSIYTNSHSYYGHSDGARRTIANTYGGSTKDGAVAETNLDYSSATDVLGVGDNVALRFMEGKAASVHTQRADDSRSKDTTERSMDGWSRIEETA